MEKRLARVNISAAGGTAGKNAKTYKLTLPSAWVAVLGITGNDREVELTLDGDRVIIAKSSDIQQFAQRGLEKGHQLQSYLFYDGNRICTRIIADFTDKTVCAENQTTDLVKTAFGRNTLPTWDDFMAFLEERCVPRQRAGLREYLESLGLDEYDPVELVKKTQGRMAEDNQWIGVTDIERALCNG